MCHLEMTGRRLGDDSATPAENMRENSNDKMSAKRRKLRQFDLAIARDGISPAFPQTDGQGQRQKSSKTRQNGNESAGLHRKASAGEEEVLFLEPKAERLVEFVDTGGIKAEKDEKEERETPER